MDPDAKAVTEAALLLSELGTNAAPAVPALIRALGDNTPLNVPQGRNPYFSPGSPAAAAALALGAIGGAAVEPLLKIWNDTTVPEDVRAAAARGIASLRDPRCGAAQLGIVERDGRNDVRSEAIRSLAANDPKAAVRPLLRIAVQPGDMAVVATALQSLRALGPEISPQLIRALYEEDSSMQELALMLLADRREKEAFEPVARLARGPFGNVRSEAARFFGRTRDVRAIVPLIELLDDHSTVVQWNAAESLIQIGLPAAAKVIEQLPTASADAQPLMASVLRNITGENLGTNAAAWGEWLKRQ